MENMRIYIDKINKVLKKNNRELSYEALEEMTYLHQVFMGLPNYCCEISPKLSPD